MKTCKGCGAQKPLSEFYASVPRCKECHKAAVKAARERKADYYKAYDRARANRPDRVAARKVYAGTDQGKERQRAGAEAWRKRNPEKRAAHVALGNAVRDGRVVKKPCEQCGTEKGVHGHHKDYSKPLEVRWLCYQCHFDHHVKVRENERQQ